MSTFICRIDTLYVLSLTPPAALHGEAGGRELAPFKGGQREQSCP